MNKHIYKNVQFKNKINDKSNKNWSQDNVKTILMTKSVILGSNRQRTNKRQTVVGFGCKFLKFCLRIKTFVQILEKEVLFAKFRAMILNIAKIHKSLVKKLTLDMLNFKIALKD